MNLNERISKILEYSQLTSSEFADAVEVQRSSMSHITSGRNKPSLDFLVKVKGKFPELEWDWIISGEGEMLKKPSENTAEEPISEKPVPTSLPDLFSLIDDDNFGNTESEDRVQKPENGFPISRTARDSSAQAQSSVQNVLNDSQRLELQESNISNQVSENPNDKVKRIVLFYESGKFESFEP